MSQPTSQQLYERVCVGGPWNGRSVQSRYPEGFLLFDKANMWGWLYAAGPGNTWVEQEQGDWTRVEVRALANDVFHDVRVVDDGH